MGLSLRHVLIRKPKPLQNTISTLITKTECCNLSYGVFIAGLCFYVFRYGQAEIFYHFYI